MRPAETILRRHSINNESAPGAADHLPGDFAALLRQLGSANNDSPPVFLASEVSRNNTRDLKSFLEYYQTQFLLPLDLPIIAQAHAHVLRGEVRELIALDAKLAAEPSFAPFAGASRRAGRTQMTRLRPLRDNRVVQRYLAAIENGRAQGWHMIAHGLTLAVYSLPLRQGLMHYAMETLGGFTDAVGHSRQIPLAESEPIYQEVAAQLPAAVEQAVAGSEIFRVEVSTLNRTLAAHASQH